MDEQNDKLKEALLKRALGFYIWERNYEYEVDGEKERLVKRKSNKKYIPPDLSALRALLADKGFDAQDLSDEELERERERLIAELRLTMDN